MAVWSRPRESTTDLLVFEGPAHVVESQDEAVEHILADQVKAGDVVVVRYEGPKGGPGMQEMLYPTSYIKSKGLGKACALLTDGRFSGGTSGLSIGHCSPEAAAGGAIGLVRTGDRIRIDIPNRTIDVLLERRRTGPAAGRTGRQGLESPPQPRATQGVGGAEGLRAAGHQCRQRRGPRPRSPHRLGHVLTAGGAAARGVRRSRASPARQGGCAGPRLPLGPATSSKLTLLPLLQRAEPVHLDGREVGENVGAARLGFDESEPFGVVEPLHGAELHVNSP
jgi:hypothetical protein